MLKARGPHIKVENRHGHAMAVAGLADISVCCAGLHGELELKGPEGKPTELQLHHGGKYEDAGALVRFASTRAEVVAFIEHLERRARGLGLLT